MLKFLWITHTNVSLNHPCQRFPQSHMLMFLSVTHSNVSLNYRSRSESPMLMLLSITHAKVFPSHPRSCFSVSIAQDWYLFMEPALAVGPEVRTQLAEGVAGSVPYPWMLRQRKWFRRNIPHTLCSYQCSFFSLAYMPALLFFLYFSRSWWWSLFHGAVLHFQADSLRFVSS